MHTFIFPVAAVLELYNHAAAAPSHAPTGNQMYNPDYLLPSGKAKEIWQVKLEDVDSSKIPPQLWLVKDQGAYLMSAGRPALLAGDPENPERQKVVHCTNLPEGAFIGGDDYVEAIELAWLANGINAGHNYLIFKITEEQLEMYWSS